MLILANGSADNTTVNSYGVMYISSGGTANNTTVNSYGYMRISSGGVANSTTVNSMGSMFISSGGVANSTTVNSSGVMYISGGVANSTTVNSRGSMYIYSGGTATNIVAESGAKLTITVASNTYIQGTYAGSAFEMKNAFISGYTVNSSRWMYISSGGVANSATVNYDGYMFISSGGTANSTTVNSVGLMYIYSGGTANNTTVNKWGNMNISSGGTAISTTVNCNGRMFIYSGGVHRGSLQIESGAVVSASRCKIDFTVSGRSVEDNYLINDLSLINGTPTYTVTVSAEQEFGTYKLAQGAGNLTGTLSIGDGTVDYGSITVNGNALEYNQIQYTLTQTDGNLLLDVQAAIVPAVFIYSSGTLTSSGAEITGATISGGNNSMYISNGGVANSTTLLNKGTMIISSGGTANSTTIYSNCTMTVSNGGIANQTTVNSLGAMHISSGGIANYTTITGDLYWGLGSMTVSRGGVANNTTVKGFMFISSGGVADSTTVHYLGDMYISSGGVANNTTVNSDGKIDIRSGGTATNIVASNGARLSIDVASNTHIQGTYNGSAFEMKDAHISGYTVNSWGNIFISRGGTADNTIVNSGGYVIIYSGGTASNTTVNYSGCMSISGGTHRGTLQIESGATVKVSAYTGGVIDFTVSERTTADGYLINDLSLISGTPTYTITVSTDQAFGTYKLAQGASSFTGSIYIVNDRGTFGSITVNGGAFIYYGIGYLLTQENGNLELTIGDFTPPKIPTATANITALTNQDVVVTVLYSEDSFVKQYRIGETGEWQNYSEAFTVTDNTTIYFRAEDAAGNERTSQFVIDYIDKVAPTLEISGNATIWTNQDVVLTAAVSDGVVEYFDGANWGAGNTITATENGTYTFRVTDLAGNVTEKSVTVDKIDKVAPTLEISGNATEPTNKDVILTAIASDGTIEYRNGAEWIEGNKLTVSENGTYQFRVTDAAGNVTEKSVVVDMIDKVAPTLEISGNVTEPTNKDVVLTATVSDGTIEYYDGKSWVEGDKLTVSDNGTYKFRVTDAAGNVTEKSVTVDMIDKVAPTLEISGNATAPTNQDVVLTATASDGTIEYFANGIWNIGNSITVTENGTYQFRVTDAAGNITEKSVTVDMIDKVAPILEISGNATAPTNKDVVLTATASDGTVEYFANGKWNKGNTITASENGTFNFRVTDAAGNVAEKSVVVNMIDKVAPTLEINGNIDTPTNKDVVLTATVSDGTVEYFNGKDWVEGNSITATENGTYQFRVTDAAGNVTEKSVTVDMIDKVAPILEISGNATAPTNQEVVLTATASDGTVEYFANGKWNIGSSLTATDNGTYQFRVTDAAGNVTEKSVIVDMIDKVAPSKPVASADVTSETKDPVTVSAAFSNDSAVKQYSLDNKTWYNYTSGVVMESNGTVYFRGIDAAGNVSQVAVYEVNNIIAAPDVIDGDLDGNGLADVILRHTKQGYSGAWLTTGDKKIIKWGSLSDIKSGTEILGTGKLVGSADDGQDIFFADSKTVGAWNVVDGKVTGYKSIMSVNATTNVIGLGDFNGDGATDLLLRSTSGDLGFYGTDGTGWEYLIGLGKEWSVAAIGDLNGDGLADTIVRHDAGFAGTFLTQTDGTVKWANLDTLKSDMTIVGTGDFNGDGVDDVLLQKDDGWVGAWLVEDGRVDSFIGLCTNKNTIEQIADFNGDGIDDLRVRDGNAIGVLYVNGEDNTTWQYFQSVGTEWDTSFSALA